MTARILIVDDEPLVLSTMERALSKTGYEVTATGTVEDFLNALSANSYNLIIMDVHIGSISPEALLAKVRGLCPDVKILTVSGSVCCGQDERHFLQKPFKIADLRQKVKDLLEGVCQ